MGVPVNALGPVGNPNVIQNAETYALRHRNANLLMAYKPTPNRVVREDGVMTMNIRQVGDNGLEYMSSVRVEGQRSAVMNDVPKPMSRETFDQMRKVVYSAEHSASTCAICQVDFDEGDDLVVTECNHSFHAECAEGWFLVKSIECPNCRAECGISIHEAARQAARGGLGQNMARSSRGRHMRVRGGAPRADGRFNVFQEPPLNRDLASLAQELQQYRISGFPL
jgi:hypothetical protein